MFHLYGLIIGIAIVVGWSLAERTEPRVGKIAPWVILGALIGARAWHVLEMWEYYRENLGQILMVWNGGMSIWGGILMGGLIIWWYDKGMLSVVATVLPLAQAVGRVANGVNREFTNKIWGVEWWGMEAILDLVLFGLLLVMPKKYRVGIYLLGYGVIRLVLQPYR